MAYTPEIQFSTPCSFECSRPLQRNGKILAALLIIASIGVAVAGGMGWLPAYALYSALVVGFISSVALVVLFCCAREPMGDDQPQVEERPNRSNLVQRPNNVPRRNQSPNHLLIPFYTAQGLDSEGRTFETIRSFRDEELESCHNYIQWLFPTAQRSQFNSQSPVLNNELLEALRSSEVACNRMLQAFARMLQFYGLTIEDDLIVRADNWEERKRVWVTHSNHNFLRITRILTCMRSMGFQEQATAFYNQLLEISREEGSPIAATNLRFWREAAGL